MMTIRELIKTLLAYDLDRPAFVYDAHDNPCRLDDVKWGEAEVPIVCAYIGGEFPKGTVKERGVILSTKR